MIFTKQEVTLHFRSGRRIRYFAAKITKTYTGNELTGLQSDEHRGCPFYFRLDEIEAITIKDVPFWKGLP